MAFSAFAAKPATTGTSTFGQSATNTAQQQQPSLFSNTNANPNAPKPTNPFGSFGTQTQTQPTQGNSLFGNAGPSGQQQTTQGNPLFGTAPAQQQQQQQPNQGSSLFGGFGQPQQSNQQGSGSNLFAQSTAGTQQQGSLFGNVATQNQSQPQQGQSNLFGGFGNNANINSSAGTGQTNPFGGFGSSTATGGGMIRQPTLPGFGMNPATTNPFSAKLQSQQPGGFGQSTTTQSLGAPLFTKSTKFNDLPDEVKKTLEAIEVFQRVTEDMRDRLRWYKATIEQIERKLSSAAAQTQYTPQAITSTLEAQHATFIALASKTAWLDAELQKIKALYTQLWRAKTGSMRDPFNELDRGISGDFGLESLSGK
ncbi:hypothetical protein EW026_g3500 [Hermanssonia centrifuga]|uniref:Uncharacterized protein n=1 Tax=Hermanssonia centrifuga TaxID=98765 RepID=A0A4S4KJY4_9APHY|nr:hypothetical protein EW026_g3500 [Hermanssonia centrifuga]